MGRTGALDLRDLVRMHAHQRQAAARIFGQTRVARRGTRGRSCACPLLGVEQLLLGRQDLWTVHARKELTTRDRLPRLRHVKLLYPARKARLYDREARL